MRGNNIVLNCSFILRGRVHLTAKHRHVYQAAVNNRLDIHSSHISYFLVCTCRVPGYVLGFGPVALNKTDKVPAHLELCRMSNRPLRICPNPWNILMLPYIAKEICRCD